MKIIIIIIIIIVIRRRRRRRRRMIITYNTSILYHTYVRAPLRDAVDLNPGGVAS